MRRLEQYEKKGIIDLVIGLMILFSILILVSVGGTLLITNGSDYIVLTILFFSIIGNIVLYIWRKEDKEKYKELLYFAREFYKKKKKRKTDEDDFEDYNLSVFERKFKNWLREKQDK